MKEFTRLVKYIRPYWVIFVLAVIAMFMTAVFETATGLCLFRYSTNSCLSTQNKNAF